MGRNTWVVDHAASFSSYRRGTGLFTNPALRLTNPDISPDVSLRSGDDLGMLLNVIIIKM